MRKGFILSGTLIAVILLVLVFSSVSGGTSDAEVEADQSDDPGATLQSGSDMPLGYRIAFVTAFTLLMGLVLLYLKLSAKE